MHVITPARSGQQLPLAAPRLVWARHLVVGQEGRSVVRDEDFRRTMVRYLADMLSPYGVPFSFARFESGNQNAYAFLAERFLAGLPASLAPDLVVIAHATADCEPGRSLAGYVTTLLPAPPLCFAVSDQDELSPFSSLNAIRALAATGWQRALVLVMDQSTLPYVTRPVPTLGADPADHAVGLLFSMDSGRTGRPLVALWQRRGVPPHGIRQALAEAAVTLPACAPATLVTVLAGCHIGAGDLPPELWGPGAEGGPLVPAPAAPSCAAAWAGLAGLAGLPASAHSGRVIVTEYAPALGGLAVAVFDPVPG
jgi:hypothetical protein